MMLRDLNDLDADGATKELLQCCGSKQGARRLADLRPFSFIDEVLRAAEDVGDELTEADWLDGFAAHPRIGEKTASAWAQAEQAAALNAAQSVQQELARA